MAKHVICDIEQRFIFLKGDILPITQTLIENSLKRLRDIDSKKEINFYITGTGGDSHASMRIHQFIRQANVGVNTICVDLVKSGSFLISQAGKKRFATKETDFGFHMAKDTRDGVGEAMKECDLNAKKHLEMAHNLLLLDAMQLFILGERGRPFSEIKKLLSKNAVISVPKALELNLIDGVFPKNKIPRI